ncbi:MAG: hypothetical protein QOE70_1976 [Chthoniobacter sp.]|jgi:uncharacterized membrane protein required for colicin V production|nr:hypothetical protein [Chthoniobacter sp.]
MPDDPNALQLAFLGGAVLVVLFKIWHGWRLGVVRQLISLGAMVAAALCGFLGGPMVGPLLRGVLPYPDRLLAVFGGMLCGLVVWLVISIVSAIVFKRTAQQSVTLIRLGYGFAGAAVGAVSGLLLVWVTVLAIRLFGSIAETQLTIEKNPQFRAPRPSAPGSPGGAHPVLAGIARLKRALEPGLVGAISARLDPIPASVYTRLTRFGQVVSDPKTIDRFITYPPVRSLLKYPKVAILFSDLEVSRAMAEHRYLALLAHPRVVAAANDPELAAALRRLDLENALDYALGKPENRTPRATP